MRRVSPSRQRIALAAALASACSALCLSTGGPDALGPVIAAVAVAAVVPILEWRAVPAALARALPRAAALVLLVVGLLAWLSRSVGTLAVDPEVFPRVAGPVLAGAALVFALAPRAFSFGGAQAPAIVGLLCVAGLDPRPDGYGGSSLPFLRAGEHSAFGERYMTLAVATLVALWTGAIVESGPRWSRRTMLTLTLSFAAAASLAAGGIVGLPVLQPHVERAVASTFMEGTTGLSGESTLGEFAELAVSERRVLDMETAGPARGEWRLPSEVFTSFDGRRWSNPLRPVLPREVLRPAAAPGSALLDGLGSWFALQPASTAEAASVDLRVTQAAVERWPLLVPRGVSGVAAPAGLLERDSFGLPRWYGALPQRIYGARWSGLPTGATGVLPPEVRAAALALPPHVDPRLLDLGRELATRASTPRSRIAATTIHLQSNFRYTLAPGSFRTRDPLAEFLFEKRAGYCEYFASAGVVLLRLQGVPARFVKGLSVGPHTDQGGGLHVVRESDAHAWVEAWVPGEGWVEADPTPPAQLSASRPRRSAVSRWREHVRAALGQVWARLSTQRPLALVRWAAGRAAAALRLAAVDPRTWLLIGTLVAGYGLARLLRAARSRRPRARGDASEGAVPGELRAMVHALEAHWTRVGHPRPPGRGLREHAFALAARREVRADVRSAAGPGPVVPDGIATLVPAAPYRAPEVGKEIVEVYYGARFGGDFPSAQELRRLHDAISRALSGQS
jgi:hypothetical protein